MRATDARRPQRVTPRGLGRAGASLATTLANTPDGRIGSAAVGATLTTRVAREAPALPSPRGALVMVHS
jgi:hypothetical protein